MGKKHDQLLKLFQGINWCMVLVIRAVGYISYDFSYSLIHLVLVDIRESLLTHMVTNELCTAVRAHHTRERAHLFMKLKKAA